MRLLRTRQYALLESNETPVPFPEYAILSHTWISPKDEVTYQDFKNRRSDIENDIYKQKGWAKLKRYCDRAARDGWDWAWMDTCCIDKTNPADTQEAINAMFRWYQNAGICYTYLEDVDANTALDRLSLTSGSSIMSLDLDTISGKDNVADPASFPHMILSSLLIKAKWFTRGWTLQELLAPPYLVFVDCAWRRIGTREHWTPEIKKACRIEAKHLSGFNPADYTSCSIAMRLSWASNRETTVEEDETYSLLGLFGISLPLIYGEGRLRAFNRLQRELITVYNDDSIFAWKALLPSNKYGPGTHHRGDKSKHGILAPSIREFWDASSIHSFGLDVNTFSMTNRGLEINAKRWRSKNDRTKCLIGLNCGVDLARLIRIPLHHHSDNSYERIQIDQLYDMSTIGDDCWEEERGNQSMFIRARSDSDLFVAPLIVGLEYPRKIRIGEKYLVYYGDGAMGTMQRLDEDPRSYDLDEDELLVKPDQLVFINIETDCQGIKTELDIIVNITDKGYPSAGILAKESEPWERLGDPLTEAVGVYQGLADYFHHKVPPVYPVFALEDTEDVVSICLIPRPALNRASRGPQEVGKSPTPREYLVKVTVGKNGDSDEETEGQSSRKRRRD
ncbi:heterokaryon incompatibility protein-domain-containing protein [Nemania sp. FL0031]|nr:heterokaryon incompatibility protein-domain-containing protein [Nemania sp. FL0031]